MHESPLTWDIRADHDKLLVFRPTGNGLSAPVVGQVLVENFRPPALTLLLRTSSGIQNLEFLFLQE
jgi:hypothetical protein